MYACVCMSVRKYVCMCMWMSNVGKMEVKQKEAANANSARSCICIYFTRPRNPLSFDNEPSVCKQAAEKQNSSVRESGRWLYSPVRTNTLSRTYRTRVVARYPCIMIISHLDALNPAACHRPVPSCTIFFRLARSNLLQSRHRRCRALQVFSFTSTLRCKPSHDDVNTKVIGAISIRICGNVNSPSAVRCESRRRESSFYERNSLNELVVEKS